MHPRWITSLSLSAVLCLTGCSAAWFVENSSQTSARRRAEAQEKADKGKFVNVSIGAVNHTNYYLYEFYVNGAMGPNVDQYSFDIPSTCCVRLPREWRPDLQVTVKWNMTVNHKASWKTKVVPIEQYTEPGSIYVHFFPNDEVRVVSSNLDPNHENHPIPLPHRPYATGGVQ